MIGKFFVELAEISKANMHNQYEKVLNILEDDSFTVECKGVDGFELESLHHFLINSNNLSAVPPGRRYLPIRSSDKYAANIDCHDCVMLMIDTEGEELMCKACVELGGYHAENNKMFDQLCAKSFYEFCMWIPDVPTKLTSTHVRQNKATAHIKEASRDIMDLWLESWSATTFAAHFGGARKGKDSEDDDDLPRIAYRKGDVYVAIDCDDLYKHFKKFSKRFDSERADMNCQSFQSRLGRKRITGISKKRVTQEGSTYRPYKYVVNVPVLIQELKLDGGEAGQRSVLTERNELHWQLDTATSELRRFEDSMAGKLWMDHDLARKERLASEVNSIRDKLGNIDSNIDTLISRELVSDGAIEAGNFVPKKWREAYDDIDGWVHQWLDVYFGGTHERAGSVPHRPETPPAEPPSNTAPPPAPLDSEGASNIHQCLVSGGLQPDFDRRVSTTEHILREAKQRKAAQDRELEAAGFGKERFDEHGNLKNLSFQLPMPNRKKQSVRPISMSKSAQEHREEAGAVAHGKGGE